MAFTYATLTTTVESYLQTDEADFQTNFPTMVRQAEDRIYKAAILPANRASASPTITASNSSVTLPDDFLAPFSLFMIVSGIYTAVDIVDISYLREVYPNPTTTGVPRFYAMATSSTLTVSPTPTSGITSALNYFYKPESIVTASTSWLGTNAENVLLYAVLAECYTYLKGDMDLMKVYEEKYQAALADLKKLGEGLDLGDAYRFGERRLPR